MNTKKLHAYKPNPINDVPAFVKACLMTRKAQQYNGVIFHALKKAALEARNEAKKV